MSPERTRFARTAIAAAALAVVDIAGTRLFEALALAEQLFAGSAWGIVVAAAAALLFFSRFALYFVLPGYLLASLAFSICPERKTPPLRNCALGSQKTM